MRQFLALLLTILFLLSSSGCGAGQVLGPTLTPTLTSTATPTLTPTATVTPSPTPTPTPSVEVGLRPENAATQTYENGTWVVKNADGQTTATWNTEKKQWDYSKENIHVEQVLIGNTVDRALIEPYLGPLPPDDPETHFIDPATGKRVDYGIGPEFKAGVISASEGKKEVPATIVYARFRGAVQIPELVWGEPGSVLIFEIPQSEDSSIILLQTIMNDNMVITALSGDIADPELNNTILDNSLSRTTSLQAAKDRLVGSMFMIRVLHGLAEVYTDTRFDIIDTRAHAILDYIVGTSTIIPSFELTEINTGVNPDFLVPENQLYPTNKK